MFNLPVIPDIAPIFGMDNTVDPKVLSVGKCARLVNAKPGNPVEPRTGSIHNFIAQTDALTIVPPGISISDETGKVFIVCWVQNSLGNYQLAKIDIAATPVTITYLGTAEGLSDPIFSFVKAYDSLYCIINELMTEWDDQTFALRNKVLKLNSGGDVIRDMSFDVGGEVLLIRLKVGNTYAVSNKFVCYAFTYVRREDPSGIVDGKPVFTSVYLPGSVEGFEDLTKRITASINGSVTPVINNAVYGTSRTKAVRQGATHVRVWKSLAQTTALNADGATKYFAMDIPLSELTDPKSIEALTLPADNVIVQITAHGWLTNQSLYVEDILGTTQLNGAQYTITRLSADTFSLNNTAPMTLSPYVSGGAVMVYRKAITAITRQWANTIKVEATGSHGLISDDLFYIVNVSGIPAPNYSGRYKAVVAVDPPYRKNISNVIRDWDGTVRLKSGTAHGLTTGDDILIRKISGLPPPTFSGQYRVTVVDADEFTLDGIQAYITPAYVSGGIVVTLQQYRYFTVVKDGTNPIKLTTTTDASFAHLSTGDKIHIEEASGTIELINNVYTITKLDSFNITLDGTDSSNFTDWVSTIAATRYRVVRFEITEVHDAPDKVLKLHIPGHDLITGDDISIKQVVGSTELNGNTYAVTVVDDNYVTLDSTLAHKFSAYVSGGVAFSYGGLTPPVDLRLEGAAMAANVSPAYVSGGFISYLDQLYYKSVTKDGTNPLKINSYASSEMIGGYAALNAFDYLATGDEIYFVSANGTVELISQTYTITKINSTEITLDGTDSSTFSSWISSGGLFYFRKVDAVIASVSAPDDLPLRVTIPGHELASGVSVGFKNITGTTELNGQTKVVTVIDDNTVTLDGTLSHGYSAYTSGGVAFQNSKNINALTVPDNRAVVEIEDHGFETGSQVTVSEVVGPISYNNQVFVIESTGDDTFKLNGTNGALVPAYVSGGVVVGLASGGVFEFDDTVGDTLLATRAAKLSTKTYTYAPSAKFSAVLKSRMWLFGIEGYRGRAFFSETPGGDLGTPTDLAIAFPQKYLSYFSYDNSIVCEGDTSQAESGIGPLGNDIYFLFEEKVYGLFGGDPQYSTPQLISPDIGCIFPHTLIKANIDMPPFDGQCLLFLSNKGPAYIKVGGEVGLFTDFTVRELWPDLSDELYGDLKDHKDYIVRNCTAGFWKDCWWIMYTNYAGVHKVFSYYFNPAARSDQKAPRGAWVVEQASV
jgi:hypothetical protein